MSSSSEPTYGDQLGAVLQQQDPSALRAFLVGKARQFGDLPQADEMEARSDEAMAELLHRMILARNDLADLHAASYHWLQAHGAIDLAEPPRGSGPPPPSRRSRPSRSS